MSHTSLRTDGHPFDNVWPTARSSSPSLLITGLQTAIAGVQGRMGAPWQCVVNSHVPSSYWTSNGMCRSKCRCLFPDNASPTLLPFPPITGSLMPYMRLQRWTDAASAMRHQLYSSPPSPLVIRPLMADVRTPCSCHHCPWIDEGFVFHTAFKFSNRITNICGIAWVK